MRKRTFVNNLKGDENEKSKHNNHKRKLNKN